MSKFEKNGQTVQKLWFFYWKKYSFIDLGTDNSKTSVNYPDYAHKLCKKVSKNSKNIGILVCGSGTGMSMSANKHSGVRSALCWSSEIAELARQHNDANVLSLPARFISTSNAKKCIDVFVKTDIFKFDKIGEKYRYKFFKWKSGYR